MSLKPTEKEPEVLKSLRKHRENDVKPLPNFLKYLKKIPSIQKYEEYKLQVIISLWNWFIDTQVRAFLLFVLLSCLSAIAFSTTPTKLMLAEGLSITWYMLIELKRDLWRKR